MIEKVEEGTMLSKLTRSRSRYLLGLHRSSSPTPQIRSLSSARVPPPPQPRGRPPPAPRPGQPVLRPKPVEPTKTVENLKARPVSPPVLQRPGLVDRVRSLFNLYLASFGYLCAGFLAFHIFITYFYAISSTYGVSMLPTIPSGSHILNSKYYRRGRGVVVGDLVTFKNPVKTGESALKRVLGLQGDFVMLDTPGGITGEATEGMMVQVPMGHCWVVGDNLPLSRDSRMFGPLPLALISGKVIAKTTGWWGFEIVRNKLVPSEVNDDDDVDD